MRAASAIVAIGVAAACGRLDFDDRGGAIDARGGDASADANADAAAVTGLLGWWPLDESSGTIAHDSAGSDDATLMGDNGPPSWEPTGGKLGGALLFAGSSSFAELDDPAALDNLPALSVSEWLQPISIMNDGKAHCVLDRGDGNAGWGVDTSQLANGDIMMFADYSTSVATHYSVGGVLALGTWTHVVATWDGQSAGSGMHLYANGAEVGYAQASDATGARPDDSAIPVGIGCINSTGFAGLIDDVRIYDHALTPAEVAAL